METILKNTVKKILTECRHEKIEWNKKIQFTIEIDGIKWKNYGGSNGNPWDLWLIKIGTSGKTKKTFRRITLN